MRRRGHDVDRAAWRAYLRLPVAEQIDLEVRLIAAARDDVRARIRLEAGERPANDRTSPTLRLLILREMLRRRLGAVNAELAEVGRMAGLLADGRGPTDQGGGA